MKTLAARIAVLPFAWMGAHLVVLIAKAVWPDYHYVAEILLRNVFVPAHEVVANIIHLFLPQLTTFIRNMPPNTGTVDTAFYGTIMFILGGLIIAVVRFIMPGGGR